jgi:hypothetical protein
VIRRALVASSLAIATLVTWPAAAGAVGGVESGWWWREQPEGGGVPAPPQVPAGGLRVASDTAGPSAVAAVRIRLGDGERDARLTLRVAAGAVQGAVVNACPAKTAWTPAGAGPWAARPEPDCSGGAVVGAVAADGSAVVFDLSTLATSGVVDVVLFATSAPPAPTPVPVPSPVPVDLAFAKPTPADVAVAGTGAPDPSPGDAPATPEVATSPLTFDVALGSTPFGLPPATAPAPVATVPARPSPARPSVDAPDDVAAPLRSVARTWDRVGEARDRLLAAFVFVDLLAIWWLLERRRRPGDARPRISLHDDPAAVLAAHATRLARRPATIEVPPLR